MKAVIGRARFTLFLLTLVLSMGTRNAATVAQAQSTDDVLIEALLRRLGQAVQTGSPDAYLNLLSESADRARATEFATQEIPTNATKVVVLERDRQKFPQEDAYRLMVDAFIEFGARARVGTWLLDVMKVGPSEWRIADQEQLSSVDGLCRLALNPSRQFAAKDFTITSEGLELTLANGSIFTVDTDQGITGLVLLGRGDMHFHPPSDTEKAQVKIFSGSETLDTRFDSAFIRVGNLASHADQSTLIERPVDSGDFRRAEQVFREESVKSYILDLADLTRDTWSVAPNPDDFLAEIRTRKYETLTYSQASSEAEDVSLFDRVKNRNISVYASPGRLAARGRFYNEEESADYDVLDSTIDLSYSPDRLWFSGLAKLHLRIRSTATGQLTLRLADELGVQSVNSARFGRLFSLRVKGQNTIVVNLPATLMPDTDETLTIAYSGRLAPQVPNRETIRLAEPVQGPFSSRDNLDSHDIIFPQAEPSFLYSNRTFWYPQATAAEYATATIRISVPSSYTCVASGEPAADSPVVIRGSGSIPALKLFTFTATRPLRYLSFIVSRFSVGERVTIGFDDREDVAVPATAVQGLLPANRKMNLTVHVNPRQASRSRGIAAQAADAAEFYESIIGDSPYQSLGLALVENNLPGGHSPAYFAVLDIPIPGLALSWRSDPAAFENYPEFFLAHEVAHQWWGQAVGWRNYHEQWLSEGFAQYFAALYAQHARGDEVFSSVIRQMRKWAIDRSDEGPVYLGYRVGHIRGDSRSFRAVIYNKGAMVLHMLRRLVGDEMFFNGLRRYYTQWRFRKAGTNDFRLAMEAETGRRLDRFFDRWIEGSSLPQLRFSYRVEPAPVGQNVVLRFDQVGDLFDVPVTVTLQYADRRSVDVVVPVTDRSVETRVALEGALRSVDISKDDASLAHIQRF